MAFVAGHRDVRLEGVVADDAFVAVNIEGSKSISRTIYGRSIAARGEHGAGRPCASVNVCIHLDLALDKCDVLRCCCSININSVLPCF